VNGGAIPSPTVHRINRVFGDGSSSAAAKGCHFGRSPCCGHRYQTVADEIAAVSIGVLRQNRAVNLADQERFHVECGALPPLLFFCFSVPARLGLR
jgi:hypothetical protein